LERITRIIAYNSWFWSLRGVKVFEQFSAFMGGPMGRFLCRNFNFFPRVMMRVAVGDKRSLPQHVHRQFTRVHRTRASRTGTWVFPKAIIGESDWLEGIWRQRECIAHLPLLLLWGMKDLGMDAEQLGSWETAFPIHETHRFDDIGHFAPEELGERAFPIVDAFLDRDQCYEMDVAVGVPFNVQHLAARIPDIQPMGQILSRLRHLGRLGGVF